MHRRTDRRSQRGSYWNGTAFASATEVLLPASGTASWSYPFAATSFPSGGTYTVRVVTTNLAGGASSASSRFAIDRTAPRVTGLTLENRSGDLLEGDGVTTSTTFGPSTVTWTASTRRLRIALGPWRSGLLNLRPTLPHDAGCTPDTALTDLAGNPTVATTFTSSGQRC